jgi:hypothetical protein
MIQVKRWIARVSDDELDFFETEAIARNKYAAGNGWTPADRCDNPELAHVIGRIGERVCAWMFGCKPCPAVCPLREPDLSNGVETRARSYVPPRVDLLFLPKDLDKAHKRFILLHVSVPPFGNRIGRFVKACGWIVGRDGMRDQFKRHTLRFDGPAWFVPPDHLASMDTLND